MQPLPRVLRDRRPVVAATPADCAAAAPEALAPTFPVHSPCARDAWCSDRSLLAARRCGRAGPWGRTVIRQVWGGDAGCLTRRAVCPGPCALAVARVTHGD